MLGMTEGKSSSGQQTMRWLDSITDSMGMNLSEFQETAKGREAWHAAVHGVAEWDTTTTTTNKPYSHLSAVTIYRNHYVE